MKESISILKEKGIVVTPQRLAVWQLIRDKKCHPCVETIYKEIKEQFPAVSLATVYTILETFKNSELLQELSIRKGKACFDPYVESHHHLLCRICDKIYDIDIDCKVAQKKMVAGHRVEDVQAYFYGVCKNCQKGGD